MPSNSQYTLPTQSYPQKVQAVMLKVKLKWTPPQKNFLAIGGYFKCYTYCVAVLEKEGRKKEDEQFWLSNVSGLPFKIVNIHIAITTADWGRL